MKKEITFEGSNIQDTNAIEWLLNLSKCFQINSVNIRSYVTKTKYTSKNRCKVKVNYG